MARKPFCLEGTSEDGDVAPHTTLWKRRQGFPRVGEWYEDGDGMLNQEGQWSDYDRNEGKTVVYKEKQTAQPGQVCPECGTRVCGTCGYGIDKEGTPNDECCKALQVVA